MPTSGSDRRRFPHAGTIRWLSSALVAALAATGCERLALTPPLYGTVTVAATTRSGLPVPGAQLELYTGVRPMVYAVTDATGHFTFESVPTGVYGVRISPPSGYAALETVIRAPETTVVDNLTVGTDGSVPVKFTLLQRGAGTVSVRVGSKDGSPLAGVATTLYDAHATVGSVRTDASGNAVYTAVPFGVYGVAVNPPVGFHELGDLSIVFQDNIVVDLGSTQRSSFALAPCQGSVIATVLDEGGAPAIGVPVALYTFTRAAGNANTGSDGTARFTGVACDEYGVSLGPVSGYTVTPGRGSSFLDGLRLNRDVSKPVSFRVASCRGSVRVLVTDASGAPVPGTVAQLYSSTGTLGTATTGSDGHLTFASAPCGAELGVKIAPPAGYSVAAGRGSSYIDAISLQNGSNRDLLFTVTRP